jgi:hypothetical protein
VGIGGDSRWFSGVFGVFAAAKLLRHIAARDGAGYGITAHWYRLRQPLFGTAPWTHHLMRGFVGSVRKLRSGF